MGWGSYKRNAFCMATQPVTYPNLTPDESPSFPGERCAMRTADRLQNEKGPRDPSSESTISNLRTVKNAY